MGKCRHWKKGNIEYLKNNYFDEKKEILTLNLNRKWENIQVKAFHLGLKRDRLSINEDFFKTLTKEMAYIFGFLNC